MQPKMTDINLFSDVKGDAKDDYRFVIQLYNPSEITKGTEDIDKDHGSTRSYHSK